MEGGKTISVVMATYNGAAYVPAQLDSILNQTLPPDEILVVDDVSQDETWAILQDYASRYPTIRVIRNEKNMGAYANFKQAFKWAKGDLIAPSDQDDIWMPGKLERMIKAFESDEYDIAYTYDRILYEDGSKEDRKSVLMPLYQLVWGNNITGHTMMFRKEVVYLFDLPGKLAFDFILSLYGAITGRMTVIDFIGSLWRRHEGVATVSVSINAPKKEKEKGKLGKIARTILLLSRGKRSAPITQSFKYRHEFLSCFVDSHPVMRLYATLMYLFARQTVFSLFKSGMVNMQIHASLPDFRQQSVITKIRRMIFAFEQPFVRWYDNHIEKAFD